jgi:hypothetical protein
MEVSFTLRPFYAPYLLDRTLDAMARREILLSLPQTVVAALYRLSNSSLI